MREGDALQPARRSRPASRFTHHASRPTGGTMAGRSDAAIAPRAGAAGAATSERPLLRVEGLNVAYGDVQVLWDVDLDVLPGEVVALVGSNGAGKTTLLSTISGLLAPRSGRITFDGQPIAGRST